MFIASADLTAHVPAIVASTIRFEQVARSVPSDPDQDQNMQAQTPSERLARLGITLPAAPKPVASYIPARIASGVVYVSGQLPFENGKLARTGTVPNQVSIEEATGAARQCAINALAVVKESVGSLDRISGVIRLGVFVACEPGFGAQPAIANGASELMAEVFGESGRHARAAVGVPALPLNAPVEIEFLFSLLDDA
jgi:enamine deaminase RidA (YjgF/YER057c/UK114 family)